MFTEELYKEYFTELHRKKKEMLVVMHHRMKEISDDRVCKALLWYKKREVRHALLAREMERLLGKTAKP
jgi:hypothetical protein